ncbi:MAG: hypothetical protein B7O98_08815 [Zestosphaera tikiterensis]|uniref:Uncharacterized protein n=1 Tax=Zestosphaera tikiterensis TaxID=1973259 RepID=A0A2R7Y2H2_9CREN|nr:MAG: hypothetical protein B7O98_08815 [Zestosphaera tikiterensis]
MDLIAFLAFVAFAVGLCVEGYFLVKAYYGLITLRGEVNVLRDGFKELSSEFMRFKEDLKNLKEVTERLNSIEAGIADYGARVKEFEDRLLTLEDVILSKGSKSKEVEEPAKTGNTSAKEGRDKFLDLKILALHSKGLSIREIAKEVGLSKSAVHKRLEKILKKKG